MLPEKKISKGNLLFCLLDAVDLVNPVFSKFQIQCAYWVDLVTSQGEFTASERENAITETLLTSMVGIQPTLTPLHFLESKQDWDMVTDTIFKQFRHFNPFGSLSEDPHKTEHLIRIIEESFAFFAQDPQQLSELEEIIHNSCYEGPLKKAYLETLEHPKSANLFESFLEQYIYEDPSWKVLPVNDQDLFDFAYAFISLASLNRKQVITHAFSVAEIANEIGHLLGIPKMTCLRLRIAALFHDLGKLGIPEKILDHPKPLSEEDRLTLQNHPFFTFKILKHLDGYRDIVIWASCHHEENDGKDYSLQFNTAAISIEMQILALAEMYTSLKEKRSYRLGYPIEDVMMILRNRINTAYSETLYMTLKQNLGSIEKARVTGESKGKSTREGLLSH